MTDFVLHKGDLLVSGTKNVIELALVMHVIHPSMIGDSGCVLLHWIVAHKHVLDMYPLVWMKNNVAHGTMKIVPCAGEKE